MPEIFEKIIEGSVGQALQRGWQDVLPEEIRKNPLAHWVLEFDSLSNPINQRDFRRDDLPRDSQSRVNWVVKRVLTPAVERLLQFYFAALFRIGRQWRVSELAIDLLSSELESQTGPRLVRPSSEMLGVDQKRFAALLESPPDVLSGALKLLLQESVKYHRGVIRVARSWWNDWNEEVRMLQNRVSVANEILQTFGIHRRNDVAELSEIVAEFLLPLESISVLYSEMQAAGVEYGAALNPDSLNQFYSLLAAIALLGDQFGNSSVFDRWLDYSIRVEMRRQDYLERWLMEKSQERIRPFVEITLNSLLEKYGKKNPFDEFSVLNKPSSPELHDLVREHTLPGGAESPWLFAWKKTLQPALGELRKPSDYDSEDVEILRSFTKSADVAIKLGLIREQITSGETWREFVQKLFEQQWVAPLGRKMGHLVQKSAKEEQLAQRDAFIKLVRNVVDMLKHAGYSLESPSEKRLAVLWDRTVKGDWYFEW